MKCNIQLKYSNYVAFSHFHRTSVNNSGLDIDKSVNPTIYKEINETYTLLKAIYDAQVTENDLVFKEKQLELKQYSKAHGYNEIDKKILDFMKANPNTSLREISEHTNYTISTIRRRISNLQKWGLLVKLAKVDKPVGK